MIDQSEDSIFTLNMALKVELVPSLEKVISLEPSSRPDPVCISWMVTSYSDGPWMEPYSPNPTTKILLSTMNLILSDVPL